MVSLVGSVVGFVYIAVLLFAAGFWTGAGHGSYEPLTVFEFPFGYSIVFWPIVFALAALSNNRVCGIFAITLICAYFLGLWIFDVFGQVRFLNVPLSSVFRFAFGAHLLFVLNLLLLVVYRVGSQFYRVWRTRKA